MRGSKSAIDLGNIKVNKSVLGRFYISPLFENYLLNNILKMETLDFNKMTNSLPDNLDKDALCTVIILIPDGINESTLQALNKSFNKIVTFVGLSHIDSEGFKEDKANLIVVNHKVPIEDLSTIEKFCDQLDVIALSFYIRYGDIEENTSCFIGKVNAIKPAK